LAGSSLNRQFDIQAGLIDRAHPTYSVCVVISTSRNKIAVADLFNWTQKRVGRILWNHISLKVSISASAQTAHALVARSARRHALRYMQGLTPVFLEEIEKAELKKLAEYAQKQIQSGVLETQ